MKNTTICSLLAALALYGQDALAPVGWTPRGELLIEFPLGRVWQPGASGWEQRPAALSVAVDPATGKARVPSDDLRADLAALTARVEALEARRPAQAAPACVDALETIPGAPDAVLARPCGLPPVKITITDKRPTCRIGVWVDEGVVDWSGDCDTEPRGLDGWTYPPVGARYLGAVDTDSGKVRRVRSGGVWPVGGVVLRAVGVTP